MNYNYTEVNNTYLYHRNMLSKVTSNTSYTYEFIYDNRNRISVVQKDGKVLRTLELGKNSSTYQQVYGKIDNSKDVLLISGNPKLTFDVTFEDLENLGFP